MSETNPSCSRGDQLRDVGMAIAAARRPDQVTLGRLAMVRAMLASPAGTATIDDATKPYEMSVQCLFLHHVSFSQPHHAPSVHPMSLRGDLEFHTRIVFTQKRIA